MRVIPATRQLICGCGATFEQTGLQVEDVPTIWHPVRCAVCQEALDSSERARGRRERVEQRRARVRGALTQLEVPPLYEAVSIDSFVVHGPPEQREVQSRMLQLARRYVGTFPAVDTLLVFRGGVGTGKGHIAWSIGKAVAEAGEASVLVVKLSDLIRRVRASWRDKEAEAEEAVLRRYRQVDLLIIDEVSRHAFYGQQIHQHLYDVIDYRVENRAPTLLTTNEDDAGVAEILRPALVDRLEGSGGIVDFGTESWRSRPREVA